MFINRKITSLLLFLYVLQIAGLLKHYFFFNTNRYLASPFIGNKFDTFMDFFNTLYFSYNDVRYTDWHSIYPPLNFLFLQFVGLLKIDELNSGLMPLELQNIQIFVYVILMIFFICPILLLISSLWKEYAFIDKLLIYFIFVTSIPFLFCLDRGNILILALPVMGGLFCSNLLIVSIAIAILINLKPYFALLILGFFFKKNYKYFSLTVVFSGVLFFISALILRDESFYLLFSNIIGFSNNDEVFSLTEVLSLPSSITAYSQVLKSSIFLNSKFVNVLPITAESIAFVFSVTKWLVIIFTLLSLLKKGYKIDLKIIFAVMLFLITNLSHSVGGYSFVYYLAILPLLSFFKNKVFIYSCMFFMFSTIPDWFILFETDLPSQFSYLSQEYVVNVLFTMGLGSLLRPFLNLLILFLMGYELFFGLNSRPIS